MSEPIALEQLTLFVEAFLVKMYQWPDAARDWLANAADSGLSLPVLFATLDPDGSWSKMLQGFSQLTLDGTSDKFLATWPQAGMMRRGMCYELPTLERPTNESEFLLLPTVTANESKGSGKNRFYGSKHFRGGKMSEALRMCETDPIYLSPSFAEWVMGFPSDWTLSVTP